LDNVSGNQIRCTDNNATFSFSNVVWIQDASFSLTWGKLDIVGNTKICGEGTSFNYQSNQVSTVRAGAMLEFDFVNFNYNTGTKNLLIMEDESSALHLDRTTLLATQPFEINRGTLFTTGNVTLNGNTLIDLQNLEHIYLHEAITQIGNVIF